MNRRDLIRYVTFAAGTFSGDGCSQLTTRSTSTADDAFVLRTREITGVTLKPDQVAPIREMLARMRFQGHVDPDVQPSLVFDPEVNVE